MLPVGCQSAATSFCLPVTRAWYCLVGCWNTSLQPHLFLASSLP